MRLFTVKTPSECIYNVQEGGSRAPGPVGEKNYTPLYSAASHASIHSFVGFSGLQGQVQERSTHKEASVCNRLKQQLTDSSFQVTG